MLMFSARARADEQHRVGAVLALDRVVAVARIPLEDVVAGAEERHVVAVVAEDEVVAVAAEEHVRPLAAEDGVVAGAAVDGQLDHPGGQRRGGDRVVSAEPVDDERVVRALGVRDRQIRAASPTTEDRGAGADHVDDVVARWSPLAITTSAAPSPAVPPIVPARSTSTAVDVGAGEVVDGERVGAAERVELDRLDVVEVHDDVAEVAGEEHPPAVGRGREDLVAGAAVEQHRVGAVLALDDVAAVARIPLEDVVAGAEEGDVVALLAVDEVVAVAAEQQVDAVAAEDGVVAGAAVDGDA